LITHEQEKDKYERMWAIDDYRCHSPGQRLVKTFLELAEWQPGDTLIDLGCGTGRATIELQTAGLFVYAYDITEKCLDAEVRGKIPFIQGCLWEMDLASKKDWIFCCDVMEHIPPEHVDAVLDRIARITKKGAFFQIALWPDGFGSRIGETLHLTVMRAEWWLEKIQKKFHVKQEAGSGDGRLICLTGKGNKK
jgi:SAM-dependent methyltransferase